MRMYIKDDGVTLAQGAVLPETGTMKKRKLLQKNRHKIVENILWNVILLTVLPLVNSTNVLYKDVIFS